MVVSANAQRPTDYYPWSFRLTLNDQQ